MSSTEATRGSAAAAPDRSHAPRPGPLRPYDFPPVTRFRLQNGLPVVFARTGGLPVVTFSVLLRAGGLQQGEQRGGLATLTSGLLDSGAGDRSGAEIAEAVEGLGVSLSSASGWDTAQVEATGLRAHADATLAIVSDLLGRATFPESEVERLRAEQLAAILQRRAEPRGLANEMAARYLFSPRSPFSRPLSGTEETIQGLTRSDVLDFYGNHYSPGGAAVVVAGEMEPEAVERLLSATLSDWAGPVPPAAQPVVEPWTRERQVIVVDRPGSVQSELRVGQIGVARSTPDYFPLVVMNAILGGAFTSRLNLNLREERGYTYGISSGFTMRREPGPFTISTAVQTEVTAPALLEIFNEVDAITNAAPASDEVEDARNYLAGIFPLRLQTTGGVAARLAEMVIHDLPEDYFSTYRERLLSVSAEEVLRVAREHLHPEQMVAVVVGDAATIRGPLEELGLGPVQVVTPAEAS